MQGVAIVGTGLIGASFGLALRETGFRGLIVGVSSSSAIAEARQAALVIVFWSKESIGSERVQAVAREALDRGSLLSVVIGEVTPPLPMARVFQYTRWDGNTADFGFSQLVYEISLLMRSGKPGSFEAASPA